MSSEKQRMAEVIARAVDVFTTTCDNCGDVCKCAMFSPRFIPRVRICRHCLDDASNSVVHEESCNPGS